MATYSLRRFAHVDGIKAIAPEHLLSFLKPYESYFEGRGFTLPSSPTANGFDYDQLVGVLMNPDSSTPNDLLDALYYVHEMSTPEAMDVLVQEAEDSGIALNGNPDPTAADVAVQIYLQNKDLLERKHAEQHLKKRRSFEYFQNDAKKIPEFTPPSEMTLNALAKDLDDWFEKKKRGRGSRVFCYPKSDGIWFLVRHGDPLRREGSLVDEKTSSVFYRPEKYDVLVYEPSIGEIRMHACGKGEKKLFLNKFGLHIFGNENFFPGKAKYTLEPLRTHGEQSLICTDIDGMETVHLKEIQFFWGGAENEIEIRKANDLFAAFTKRGYTFPQSSRIIKASFLVKFEDSKTARTVTIRPSNIAQYSRDCDANVVEEWLVKRGFILPRDDDTFE